MATMKNHLADMHKREAAHHTAAAGHFQELVKCIAKASNEEVTNGKDTLAALVSEHQSMATYHADCADKCAKANDNDLDKLQPSQVSGLALERSGIHAIPRTGQPVPVIPNVPLEFEKVFSIDDE
jgi:hypothetical protein